MESQRFRNVWIVRMIYRIITAVVAFIVVVCIDLAVLLQAAEQWGFQALLVVTIACAAIGVLVVRFALGKYGSKAFQAISMYRSSGCVFSPDHSLEDSLLSLVGFLVAGAAFLMPGFITGLAGLFVIAIRPLRSLAAATVLWIVAPNVFGGADDAW